MEIEKRIRRYIIDNLFYLDDGFEYTDNTSLIGEGLIDSVGIVELVTYVQAEFGITVAQRDITLDNFDSVAKIAALVRRTLPGLSGPHDPERAARVTEPVA